MQRKCNKKNTLYLCADHDTRNETELGVKRKMKENKSLEFKATITNSFLKTVSAYSNFHDGENKCSITCDNRSVSCNE